MEINLAVGKLNPLKQLQNDAKIINWQLRQLILKHGILFVDIARIPKEN